MDTDSFVKKMGIILKGFLKMINATGLLNNNGKWDHPKSVDGLTEIRKVTGSIFMKIMISKKDTLTQTKMDGGTRCGLIKNRKKAIRVTIIGLGKAV